MIPVAARYVLRRNTFGFDINKRGTPQGEMVTMHSLIKLKSQEQKLALPEPALIKEKACYIDDDCDHRERQRISSLTFSRYLFAIADAALLFASSELTYTISMFQVDSAKHGPVSHTTTDYLARCKIGFTWTEKMVTNLGEVPLRSKKKIVSDKLYRALYSKILLPYHEFFQGKLNFKASVFLCFHHVTLILVHQCAIITLGIW
ncbi:unnamed protein product [Brassica oleracea]